MSGLLGAAGNLANSGAALFSGVASSGAGTLLTAAQNATGIGNLTNPDAWVQQLRAASFRGVPFSVEDVGGRGGRRLVTHEFPLCDTPSTEDLGRAARRYSIRAYVIGGAYMQARDALLKALENSNVAGTLVHPTLGEKKCRAGLIRWTEHKDRGGYCAFDLEFVEDGPQPSPTSQTNTVATVLGGITSALTLAKQVYAIGSLIASNPSVLFGLGENILGNAAASFLNLPAGTIAGITSFANSLTSIATAAGADDPTASAVLTAFSAAADNVVAAQQPLDQLDDPVLGTLPVIATSADITGGLAALASFSPPQAIAPILSAFYGPTGYTGPTDPTQPPSGATAAQVQAAALQQMVVDLVAGSATLAVSQIYAETTWTSSNAAAAARSQLQSLFDARIDAAANAGQEDLYRGWMALEAMAMQDLIARAQNLPSLSPFVLRATQPSLTLAQLFYQDSTRGDELALLNDVPHPLFMPLAGYRLSA